MRVSNDCVVSLQFTLSDAAGQVLDRSPPGEPLQYLHGAPGLLPMLSEALAGRVAGESFDVLIPPERGFGHSEPTLIERIPLASWNNVNQLEVGGQVERTDEEGNVLRYRITSLDDGVATLDGNHPLAGVTLRFAGSVLEVRPASPAEKAAVAGS